MVAYATASPSPPVPDKLGAHVSVAGGVQNAPSRAAALPAGAFQIFSKNQAQWRSPPLRDAAVAAWFAALAEHGYTGSEIVVHGSYLINLAAGERDAAERSRRALTDEIERCARLAVPHLVLHPGSHLGAGEAVGLATVAANLDRSLEAAGAGPVAGTERVCLCLETTAGQGTNLGYRFAHLRDIIASSRYPERLAVCLDTCHVFAAGYGLRTPASWRRTMAHLDAAVGWSRVAVVHLNDSKRDQGSRVDRHARIGAGAIGAAAFGTVVRTRRLAHALMILEVPGGAAAFAADLALLRELRRGARR